MNTPAKIGIMAAMPEEVALFEAAMTHIEKVQHASNTYICGRLCEVDCVLVISKMGLVAGALTATSLIEKFHIDHLIFTGVAGAVNPALNIGDVVISESLFQHDMDGSAMGRFKKYEVPLTGKITFEADSKLQALTQAATQSFLTKMQQDHQDISAKALKTFGIENAVCTKGIIASGNHFVMDTSHLLNCGIEQVQCVEMEGAAVAQVCHAYQMPFVVIRTISDKANHDAVIDFLPFVEQVASHYSLGIIKQLLPQLIK